MKKKLILFGIIMSVGIQMLIAQNIQVTGKVVESATGQVMPGVTVQIKGTSVGTATDVNGNFSIQVPGSDAVLVFSFIGFQEKEIPVGNQRTINIELEESTLAIDDVIVVAYGTTTKASFTGSAATVKSEAINRVPVTSFEKALAGSIAGVQVSNTTGQPGSGTEIRIRGLGSFSASNEPLYVIDGVPVMSGSMHNSAGGLPTGNVMSTIPAGDIESVTVLKDAAAASLYGSRAANGVILITTKHGKEGVTSYNLKTVYGISDFATNNLKTVSGEDFLMLHRESMENFLASGNAPPDLDVDQTMLDHDWFKPDEGFTNWYDHLFRKGKTKNVELFCNRWIRKDPVLCLRKLS
ncbi:MAG: TonB-dependent receptor plug domain-containing protein [Bacteroidales bacterium]